MITLKNLTAGYDRRPAVHHVSGCFEEGSLTALIGPNGGGKSTLLKTLAGVLRPLSGTVECPHPRNFAYLPQGTEIDRAFPVTVLDVALMGTYRQTGMFRGVSKQQRAACHAALETVGMASFAARPIGALSIGQFQRILFARLMLMDAAVLLLDEPFAAIDARTAHDLLQLIEQWHKQGKTIIVALHDMAQVRAHFPRAFMLARRTIAWGETPVVLAENHMSEAKILSQEWHDHAAACGVG